MFEILAIMLKGFATSAGLIMAIGAQNAFVLSQGVKNNFHIPIAITCIFLDVLLIFVGVAGMGMLITQSQTLATAITVFGALFLTGYGARALLSALRPRGLNMAGKLFISRKTAVLATLALSLLNPHVYLDTVVLIGSVGAQYGGIDKWWFALGAATASVAWFNLLCWGARRLAPLFSKPKSWQVMDLGVCVMMWTIALSLWRSLF
jgi:L-lysine exporter family protein LysE/ArgO